MIRPFLVTETWLGRLLVARSQQGLCWVSLGDDDEALEGELRAAQPDTEAAPDDARLREWAAAVNGLVEAAGPAPDIPLDPGGSLFQRRVWWALRAVPQGQTRTYGEIARSLGGETAPRAVARACAANSLAVVIPCHRAIGQDGDLTGYRWGIGRKRLLLERERQAAGGPLQLGLF